ncbi:acetolactate synthase i ii iii large subunit [Fusarium sporotrichioides]|uniref:Acetolactate synthase n=1 Tax=Fusarium sporotrichioides TaxID=5514 RepID=A0A395RYS8_FUSSP|nr:acetolactate synthase i ii iii large subunit [Fusarium sporotrichioides]
MVRANNTAPMNTSFIGKSGAAIFEDMMFRHGVKHIFGYPGAAIVPVFEAIYNSKRFNFILSRHEQGAGHMSEGYARATGKPGIVLVTSGPGATNVITPMQDAFSDGTPIIVFTGQVATTSLGTDAFQEADIVAMSGPCTKRSFMVRRIHELPWYINEAFKIATNGRPGPVLVDLPKDMTSGVLEISIPPELTPSYPSNAPTISNKPLSVAAVTRISNLINQAKQPVICAGQGILWSHGGPETLKQLAEKCSIPVTTTLLGLGAYDELDRKSLHMLGEYGTVYANKTIQEADLIIALGARFDERVTIRVDGFAPGTKAAAKKGCGGIIHFEMLPENINKTVQVTEAIEGDLAQNLNQILPFLHRTTIENRQEWFDKIDTWKKQWPLRNSHGKSTRIEPETLIDSLSTLTANRKLNTYVSTGVGQHQMWTAQHFRWRLPRSMITSGGLGTMGYGLPAAIGVKVARPEALVIDIDGDASFNMTLAELATAVQFNISVKIIILNNEEQGMITELQNLCYKDMHAYGQQTNPDFVKLANSMGVQSRRVDKPNMVLDALEWLINTNGPSLLEVMIDNRKVVIPKVPAKSTLHENLLFDKGIYSSATRYAT